MSASAGLGNCGWIARAWHMQCVVPMHPIGSLHLILLIVLIVLLPYSCWSGGTAQRSRSWGSRRRCPHPRRRHSCHWCRRPQGAWNCRRTRHCARCAAAAAPTQRWWPRLVTCSATHASTGRCLSGGAALSHTPPPGWNTCGACTRVAARGTGSLPLIRMRSM